MTIIKCILIPKPDTFSNYYNKTWFDGPAQALEVVAVASNGVSFTFNYAFHPDESPDERRG